jgi:hypothetical protein
VYTFFFYVDAWFEFKVKKRAEVEAGEERGAN